jgi:hypothetical protein
MKWPQPVYVVSAILFLIAVHIFATSPPIPRFGQWLHQWQDLVAGLLALLGAYWALMGVRQQIEQSEKIEDRRLQRVYEARRATLPFVLSSAASYAQEAIRSLAAARCILTGTGNRKLTGQWSPPVFPSDLPNELREYIESSANADANLLVFELLRQMQTLYARMNSLVSEDRAGKIMELAEYQIQASKVKQVCGALFPFARGETEEVPDCLLREQVINTIQFIDHLAEDDPTFLSRRDSFLQAGRHWWVRNL